MDENINVRASDMPTIERDQPVIVQQVQSAPRSAIASQDDTVLYTSQSDEDRKQIQPLTMRASELLEYDIKKPVTMTKPVTEFAKETAAAPASVSVSIDKKKLVKAVGPKTAKKVIKDIKAGRAVPSLTATKVIKAKAVIPTSQKPVAPAPVKAAAVKKAAARKNDIFDNMAIYIIKTFNI